MVVDIIKGTTKVCTEDARSSMLYLVMYSLQCTQAENNDREELSRGLREVSRLKVG